MASGLGTPYAKATLAMMRGAAAMYEGRHFEVDAFGQAAEDIFREQCLGASWEESVCAALRYSALEMTGPMTRLCEAAPVLLRRANERADQFSEATLGRTMSHALLSQDRPAEALAFLEERIARLGSDLDLRLWLLTQSVVDVLSYLGDHDRAWHELERSASVRVARVFDRAEYLRYASHYRRARRFLGWDDAATVSFVTMHMSQRRDP
jgi:hypothetical protein